MADDLVTFIEDDPPEADGDPARRWKVIVIDDDGAVHDGTRFALYDYVLNGQGLEIISAYSAAEGREMLRIHPDTAVVLLDVVMESEVAGLDLVDYIRNELKNETVRIILRTGQPGQAPERRVIIDYDINDYKAKTELTADKLFTTLDGGAAQLSAAAAHGGDPARARNHHRRRRQAVRLSARCSGWRRACSPRSPRCSMSIAPAFWCCATAAIPRRISRCWRAPAATSNTPARTTLENELRQLIERRRSRAGATNSMPQRSVLYIKTGSGREVVVLLEAARYLSDTDRALVEVFCSKLSVAFDNVILYEELQEANARLEERVMERTRELTLANERLAAQWERLRRANLFKREIIGTVAHDLKNPLGVIMGRAEMLKDIVAASPIRTDVAGRADPAHPGIRASRLTGMVDTLLADAMADALDINLRLEPVDLSGLVNQVVETSRQLAAKQAANARAFGAGAVNGPGRP